MMRRHTWMRGLVCAGFLAWGGTAFGGDSSAATVEIPALVDTAPAGRTYGELVKVGSGIVLKKGETSKEIVAIFGDAVVDGVVHGDAVAVGGALTINGTVTGQAVAVGGKCTVGPSAIVKGGLVSVMGASEISDRAQISGEVVTIGPFLDGVFDEAKKWIFVCLLKGRPAAPELPWTMAIVGGICALALLLSLVFRNVYTEGVHLTRNRPGAVMLAGLLTIVAFALGSSVLTVTVIGMPLIPVFWMLVAGLTLIGLFSVLSQAGTQALSGIFRVKDPQPVLGGLIGLVVFVGLLVTPFVGFLAMGLAKLLGAGAGTLAFLELVRRTPRKDPPLPRPPSASGPAATTPPLTLETSAPAAPPPALQAVAPSTEEPAPPSVKDPGRATMWLRLGAALIDFILAMMVYGITLKPILAATHGICGKSSGDEFSLTVFLVYLAVMWAWKGTTVGGAIFRHRIQRVGGGSLTIGTAALRALGLVLSVVPLGLGFFWMRWDPLGQTWHDRIAGTEVLQMPAGTRML